MAKNAEQYFDEGVEHAKAKRFKEAIADFDKAIEA